MEDQSSEKNSRRLRRFWRRKSWSLSEGGADFQAAVFPKRAQGSKNFEISSEIEKFRARMKFSSEPPTAVLFFVGNRDAEIEIFRARLKILIEIESFERDLIFLIVGPSGSLPEKCPKPLAWIAYSTSARGAERKGRNPAQGSSFFFFFWGPLKGPEIRSLVSAIRVSKACSQGPSEPRKSAQVLRGLGVRSFSMEREKKVGHSENP